MIILGMKGNGFIVEISAVEMANIHGFRAINAPGYTPPSEGATVNIEASFQKAEEFNNDNAQLLATKTACQAIVTRLTALGV